VDRKQREYTALRKMGINVDDSLRLTKFIQQDTTNSKYKSLAQTIFTTPNMTLSRATSLFEMYHPDEQLAESSFLPSVVAMFCRYCKKKGRVIQSCMKKSKNDQSVQRKPHPEEDDPANYDSPSESDDEPSTKTRRYMCALCDMYDHPSLRCPRLPEVRQYLRELNSHS
jgi:ribosomal protein L44E